MSRLINAKLFHAYLTTRLSYENIHIHVYSLHPKLLVALAFSKFVVFATHLDINIYVDV